LINFSSFIKLVSPSLSFKSAERPYKLTPNSISRYKSSNSGLFLIICIVNKAVCGSGIGGKNFSSFKLFLSKDLPISKKL
tara:strand:- start:675 stop:914 length:240 start_codon:yes stop_codon:yes gene_type:complete